MILGLGFIATQPSVSWDTILYIIQDQGLPKVTYICTYTYPCIVGMHIYVYTYVYASVAFIYL